MFEPLTQAELAALDPPGILAYVADARAAQQQAEAAVVAGAAAWAHVHSDVETNLSGLPGIEKLIDVGGDGTPPIGDLSVAELGAHLGASTASGRLLLADALDLVHRLPSLWRRVLAGEVPVWKARRVADKTRHLSRAAAADLDRDICEVAGRLPMARLDRVVRAAIIHAQPAAELADADAAVHRRGVWLGEHGEDGNTEIVIRTDTSSALRFDALIGQVARGLCDGDDTLTLDQRRALAVGLLTGADAQGRPLVPATIYVHIDAATLTGDAHVARVEGAGPLVAEQVRGWLRHSNVTVKPVINLNHQTPVDNWETPLTIREQVRLRSPVDMFPHSTCTTRAMDLDHTEPFDPDGPPGQTRADNLAPLTRGHHRVKTHGGWQVAQPFDGVLVWRSPHGHNYLVDHTGTRRQ